MRTASQGQGACRGRGGRYGQEALSEEGPRGLSLWQPADPGEDLSVQAEWEAWPEEEALQGMGMRLETRRGPWGLMTRASSRVPESLIPSLGLKPDQAEAGGGMFAGLSCLPLEGPGCQAPSRQPVAVACHHQAGH